MKKQTKANQSEQMEQTFQPEPMAEAKKEDNGYVVPFNEKHLYHCRIEVKKFNAETGERLSKPRIQKFGMKTFQMVLPKLREQGYSVEILYSPKK